MFKRSADVVVFQLVAAMFGAGLVVMSGLLLFIGFFPIGVPLAMGLGGIGWLVASFLPILLARNSKGPGNGGTNAGIVLSLVKKTVVVSSVGDKAA